MIPRLTLATACRGVLRDALLRETEIGRWGVIDSGASCRRARPALGAAILMIALLHGLLEMAAECTCVALVRCSMLWLLRMR